MKNLLYILIFALLLGTAWASTGLVYHEVQIVDETGAAVTDISSISIYNPDTTTNATIYMDRALANAITVPITTSSTNTTFTQSTGTLYWWGSDGYDYSFTNGTNIARNAGHRTRNSSEGTLYFPSYLADISSATYEDDETISMGDGADFVINAGTTADRLTFTPETDGTSSIYLGSTAKSCDVAMWGNTAGYDLMWDASDNRFEFDDSAILSVGTGNDWTVTHSAGTTTAAGALTHSGAQTFSTDCLFTGNAYNVEWDNSSDTFHLLDNAELGLGGATTADGDIVLKWDAVDLDVLAAADATIWKWGNGTNDFDMWWYGGDAGDYMLWDEGVAELTFVDAHIQLNDDATLTLGTTNDWVVQCATTETLEFLPSETTDDCVFNIGSANYTADVTIFGKEASEDIFWDASLSTLYFGAADNFGVDVIFYGDTASNQVHWDCSGDEWIFGADAEGVDVTLYGTTTGKYAKWDESADSFEVNGQFDIGELVTFGESDETPDVHGHCYFITHATTDTITDFDGTGIDAGQIIIVESAGAITYDVTSSGLKGGSTDIITADGDQTAWVYNGTDWLLIAFMDLSDDENS